MIVSGVLIIGALGLQASILGSGTVQGPVLRLPDMIDAPQTVMFYCALIGALVIQPIP